MPLYSGWAIRKKPCAGIMPLILATKVDCVPPAVSRLRRQLAKDTGLVVGLYSSTNSSVTLTPAILISDITMCAARAAEVWREE